MLTALRVGNFKAFAETQLVPIRPLTLIYGANSSGKSSLIHSLLLARHAMDKGDLDIHRTEVGGDSVDLGGFRQYVHCREVNRHVEWAVELDVAGFKNRLAELLAPVNRVIVSVTIGIPLDDKGLPVRGVAPEVYSYEVEADDTSLFKMSRRPDGNLRLDRLDHEHRVFRKVLKAIVETSTTTESVHPADFEGLEETIASIVPEINTRIEKFLPAGLIRLEAATATGGQLTLFPISRGRRKEDLAAAVRFFLPRTLDELIAGLSRAVSNELSRIHYLGPLRSYPPRHLAFAQHHDPNWYAGGGYAWDVVRHNEAVRKVVNAWLSSPDRLQTPYELVVYELVGIDQLEEPLLDGLEGIEIDIVEEGHPGGEYRGKYYDPEPPIWGIKDVEAEVAKLRDRIRLANIDKLFELILVDRRSNTLVSHRDIGVGISQVLPVLVSAYAHTGKIIAIEQPEIHLHPALQADLADVFIESALGERRNTLILESHSEHLLLRIMRRMRETAKNEKKIAVDVTPKDVMVLFVERVDGKTLVREMPLNEYGELIKAWPGGFFEEGFREVFAD